MNFEKFKTVLKENPWLESSVRIPNFVNDPEDQQKHSWVKHHVDYIAFRPLDQLDLSAGNRRVEEALAYESVIYAAILHINGNDEPHSRKRWVSQKDDEICPNEHTVELLLGHLCEWHKECWSPKGHDLVISYVIKTTVTGLKKSNTGQWSLAIDIYPIDKTVAAS